MMLLFIIKNKSILLVPVSLRVNMFALICSRNTGQLLILPKIKKEISKDFAILNMRHNFVFTSMCNIAPILIVALPL